MAKGLLVDMPYRKQSHDCSGIILFRNDDDTNCHRCHLGCHCNPRGHLRHFSFTGTQLRLLPEVRTPPPSPVANRNRVFKIWKGERKQVSFVFLFSIATVTGKNWISGTWALQLSPSSLPYQPAWGCRG